VKSAITQEAYIGEQVEEPGEQLVSSLATTQYKMRGSVSIYSELLKDFKDPEN
jgi:hypothetical protein